MAQYRPERTVDRFEYYGTNEVAVVRVSDGYVVWRRWILFDSAEEAASYYHEQP